MARLVGFTIEINSRKSKLILLPQGGPYCTELVYEDVFQLVPLFYAFGINVLCIYHLPHGSYKFRIFSGFALINPTTMVHRTIRYEFFDIFFF